MQQNEKRTKIILWAVVAAAVIGCALWLLVYFAIIAAVWAPWRHHRLHRGNMDRRPNGARHLSAAGAG